MNGRPEIGGIGQLEGIEARSVGAGKVAGFQLGVEETESSQTSLGQAGSKGALARSGGPPHTQAKSLETGPVRRRVELLEKCNHKMTSLCRQTTSGFSIAFSLVRRKEEMHERRLRHRDEEVHVPVMR